NGFASAAAVGEPIVDLMQGKTPGVDLSLFAWPRPPATKIRPDAHWVRR
ncbi:MAG: hypothetical protein JNN01_05180, partial [Opitutaceae bacterium]|nr:hypothetical protein [Opitutaceae bacterium]